MYGFIIGQLQYGETVSRWAATSFLVDERPVAIPIISSVFFCRQEEKAVYYSIHFTNPGKVEY